MKNVKLLIISGISGILTPVFAFTFILLAIASYPPFSWTDNALSDLGVVSGLTSTVFNSGLIISGILALVFAIGLFVYLDKGALNRIGAFMFALASVALFLIGIFPENVVPTHYLVSVAFFVLLPISLLIITGAFWLKRKTGMALFTLLVAVAAAVPWVLLFSVHYVSGVAIPEFVSGLAGTLWAVAVGYKMVKKESN